MRKVPGKHNEIAGGVKDRVAVKSWVGSDLDLIWFFFIPKIQDIDVEVVGADRKIPFRKDDHLF